MSLERKYGIFPTLPLGEFNFGVAMEEIETLPQRGLEDIASSVLSGEKEKYLFTTSPIVGLEAIRRTADLNDVLAKVEGFKDLGELTFALTTLAFITDSYGRSIDEETLRAKNDGIVRSPADTLGIENPLERQITNAGLTH